MSDRTPRTSDDYASEAESEWAFAHRADREGKPEMADRARDRALEYEKCRDSWLYRVFGW